jgi:hypothetical protein
VWFLLNARREIQSQGLGQRITIFEDEDDDEDEDEMGRALGRRAPETKETDET